MTFNEMMKHAAECPLTKAEVELFCTQEDIDVEALCDRIARKKAVGYASNGFNFLFCDSIMNHLHALMIVHYSEVLPPYAWSVFLAFDAGEYEHPGDLDASPKEPYTRPLIAEIVASHQA